MFSKKILQGIIPSDHYDLSLINVRNVKKFNAELLDYIVKFKNIPEEFSTSLLMMEKVMRSIVKDILIRCLTMS